MASPQGIKAGKAYVEILADNTKLIRGLKAAQARLKAFGASVRAMGMKMMAVSAVALAPLAGAAKYFSSYGDQVAKMAKRTGLSVEALSEMNFVASQTGTSIEGLETGFRRMQRSIFDAGRGLSTQTEALEELGLSYEDLKDLAPEDQFAILADKLGKLKNDTNQAAIAQMLFGRAGTQLIPMFEAGAAGIKSMREEAQRLGLTMSGEDAAAAEVFTDKMDALWKVVKMGVFTIGSALAPALTDAAKWITNIAVKTGAWIRENKGLVSTIFKVATGVAIAGASLVVLGGAISMMGMAFGAAASVVSVLGTTIGVLATVLGVIVSPIGLVVAGLAGLAGYALHASGAAGKAADWLGEKFGALASEAGESFSLIGKALASGNISLAAKLLWSLLKLEFTKGVGFLNKLWLGFKSGFVKVILDGFYGVQAGAQVVFHGLESAWINSTAFLSKTWTKFTSGMAKAFLWVKNVITKGLNIVKGKFDETFDVETANKAADESLAASQKIITDEAAADVKARETERANEKTTADKAHNERMANIGTESIAAEEAVDDDIAKQKKASEDRVAATREAYDEANTAARRDLADKKTSSDSSMPSELADPKTFLAGVAKTVTDKIQVKGTFSAQAAARMGSGSTMDRVAKASEETAKNTKKIARTAGTSGVYSS